MEKMTIGFSRPIKWAPFSWLIMKGYGIDYSHVYVKFHSASLDRDIIYQASKNMINFMGTVVFQEHNVIVREFQLEITLENKNEIMKFAIDNAGKPYSIKEAIGLGWVRLNALFGKKVRNPYKFGNDEYVCSVLADYILDKYTDKGTELDYQEATPQSIYNHLVELGL